jgi:hypothetical protein
MNNLSLSYIHNHVELKKISQGLFCTYVEAPSAASCWAHDGGRQRRSACPLLFRYCLIHTYCSLDRLAPIHPFVRAPILQRHSQVPWRAYQPAASSFPTHTRRMDGLVSATKTKTLTSSTPSQDCPFYLQVSFPRPGPLISFSEMVDY